jgi:hypothetical protein
MRHRIGAQLNAPDLGTASAVIIEGAVIVGWLGVGDHAVRYSRVVA